MNQGQTRTQTRTQIAHLGTFTLDCGQCLPELQLAYESYGSLNEKKDNVLLLYHALTGSHHAHGLCEELPEAGDLWKPENHQGWWDTMIGPGKPLDTDQYFIICVNYIGSCYGSSGPCTLAPDGKPWAERFPLVSAHDQVRAQFLLLDQLGIDRVGLIAASVGGLCGIVAAINYPQRVKGIVFIGVSYKIGIEHKLSVFEQVLAIENDSKFLGGAYTHQDPPLRGLALARIICHKLFIAQDQLEKRARKGLVAQSDALEWYQMSSNTESYMLHQGTKFAKRFDANAYLRIITMWGQFDLLQQTRCSSLKQAFTHLAEHQIPTLLFSISSDLCFTPKQIRAYHRHLINAGVESQYHCVKSTKGHDSFLVEPERYEEALRSFLFAQNERK